MRRLVILLILLLVSGITQAQNDWIYTLKGDTIFGKIGFLKNGPYQMDEVSIKGEEGKQILSPLEVKRARKNDDEYVPLKINNKYQFGMVVSEGYLSWYKYINPESSAVDDFSLTVLVKLDGQSVQLSNLGFMKALTKFLDDCDPLVNKLENSEYKPKDLAAIIEFYNSWIDEKSNANLNQNKVVVVENEMTALISDLLLKVKGDPGLSGNAELIEMLLDVQGKLKDGKAIPAYLKGAVIQNMEGYPELIDQFNSLFE